MSIDYRAVIGAPPQHRDYRHLPGIPPIIDPSARIEAFSSVDAGTMRATVIGPNVWLMKSVHVGHDSIIGAGTEIAPMTSIGGWVEIGEKVSIGQGVTIRPRRKIGDGAVLGMGAVVIHDVPAGVTVVGNPAMQLLRGKGSRRKQEEMSAAVTGEVLTPAEEEGWQEYADAAALM